METLDRMMQELAPVAVLLAEVLGSAVEPLPPLGEETQAGYTVRPITGRES